MGKAYFFFGIFAFAIAGCSASAGRPECNNPNCNGEGNKDLGPPPADLTVVALPDLSDTRDLTSGMKGFGDPCGDKSECASGICIFNGIGGTCSKLCDNDPCPEGYGCFGVLGAVDPGQVADVCVIDKNQLCTPCSFDSECSVTSHDICYDFPSGGKYCARDCSTVSCPAGYNCQDIPLGDAGSLKQCVPTSGACDCNAMLQGAKKDCPITTPFGTCTGSETCNGAGGWGSCAPPSTTDDPDDRYVDANCDGIDGDITKGVFVATNAAAAVDDNTCGTLAKPCKTIGKGMTQSLALSVPNLYVQAGNYNEVVTLQAGKNIYGGYDANWQRGDRGVAGHTVTITGALDATDGQYLTLKAHDLVVNSTIDDLVLVGPTPVNPSANGATGPSTYVVHARNATLTLHNVTVTGGNGAQGHSGSVGSNASSVTASSAMNGSAGGNAQYDINVCNDSSFGASGAGGSNASCSNTSAGSGGNGGKEDTDCCCFGVCVGACCNSDCNATGGGNGTNGAQVTTSPSRGHGGPSVGTCTNGSDGEDGSVHNGSSGGKGSSGSFDSNGYWTTNHGGNGGAGGNGGGGGGGSASGGCDSGNVPFENSTGAGGGGGGAGGCAAISGGGGGGGGGSSIAVMSLNSTVTLTNCIVTRGNGGGGGDGGIGGRGQSGGAGNTGGTGAGSSPNGNAGGHGGHGGHGGGGGGGGGGDSYGVFKSGTGAVTVTSVTFSGPTVGGSGGARGLSAPTAPVGENDGNDGLDGDSGAAANCSAGLSCP